MGNDGVRPLATKEYNDQLNNNSIYYKREGHSTMVILSGPPYITTNEHDHMQNAISTNKSPSATDTPAPPDEFYPVLRETEAAIAAPAAAFNEATPTYLDPNDVVEDPPLDPLEAVLRWGAIGVVAGYAALLLLFTNPEAAFGNLDPMFRDTYKFSFAAVAFSALYVLNTARKVPEKSPERASYVLPTKLLLAGAALWVPLLYIVELVGSGHFYSSVWYVVATRVVAAAGAILLAFRIRDRLMESAIGTGALYYLLFHVILVDGMVWSYSYIIGNEG